MKNKSFTLIELLVVIVIIGILAGVIIVSVSSSINKANFAKAQSFSNTVQNELLGDLVSEWTFDIASNPGEDTWGNNDGIVTGATYQNKASGNCVYGGCYSFDGTDYIYVPDKPEFNFGTQMSAFVWIKGNNTSTSQGILSQYDSGVSQTSWLIYHTPTYPNKLTVRLSSNGSSIPKVYYSTANILDNIWHLVGFTFGNGTLKLYIDGQEAEVVKGADVSMTTLFNSTSNIGIGCYYSNNNVTSRFQGSIDDARIYNAALSSAQIKQQYVAGLNSLLANNSLSKEEYLNRIENLSLND